MLNPWKELKEKGAELIEARAEIALLQERLADALSQRARVEADAAAEIHKVRVEAEAKHEKTIEAMAEQIMASREMMAIAILEHAKFEASARPGFQVFQLTLDLDAVNVLRLKQSDIQKRMQNIFMQEFDVEASGFSDQIGYEMEHIRCMVRARIEDLIQGWYEKCPSDLMDSIYRGMRGERGCVYGMDFPIIMEFRRQYLKGNGEFPMTRETVKQFFDRSPRGPERFDPRSAYTARDVDAAFRRSTPYREHPHADAPPPVSQSDAGLVLPDPSASGVHADQPAEGETLPADHSAHPEQGR